MDTPKWNVQKKHTSELNGSSMHESFSNKAFLIAGVESLITTPSFLRLKRIQQLGFVNRIWPEAIHTRYDHSLGCYYLAHQAIHVLRRSYLFDEQAIKTFLLASLLHDIGHYDFAHYIEELGKPMLSHEQVGRRIIEQSEIATILERDYQISPRRVADLIDPPRDRELPPDDALLGKLLSGALDIDKLDYLPRDAKACHVSYGRVDVARLITSLRIYPLTTGQRRIMLAQEGVEAVSSFLSGRQAMYLSVYRHPRNRICHAMLRRAIQDALIDGTLSAEELTHLDDARLLALLAHNPVYPRSTRVLAQGLGTHQHYHILLEMSYSAPLFSALAALLNDAWQCQQVEQFLVAELSRVLERPIEDYELLMDFPPAKQWDMDGWFLFSSSPMESPSIAPWSTVLGLFPEDFQRYEDAYRSIRVLASKRIQKVLQADAQEIVISCLERLLMKNVPFCTSPLQAKAHSLIKRW